MHHKTRVFYALLLTICILTTMAYASEASSANECTHHPVHDESCGFREAIPAAACEHLHDDSCYAQICLHTAHDGSCGYAEAIAAQPCGHTHDDECYQTKIECAHGHTDSCGFYDEEGSCNHSCNGDSGCLRKEPNCSHAHDGDCGYAAAIPGSDCGHKCTAESCCVTPDCKHEHDGCGFVEAVEAVPCTFVCSECTGETDEEPAPEPTEEPDEGPEEEPVEEPNGEIVEQPEDETLEQPESEDVPIEQPEDETLEQPESEDVPVEQPEDETVEQPETEDVPIEQPENETVEQPEDVPDGEAGETAEDELTALTEEETVPDEPVSYTLTIPTSLVLDPFGGSTTIETDVANLPEGRSVCITVTSANSFHLNNGDGTVEYTLHSAGSLIATNGVVAEFTENGERTLGLNFQIDDDSNLTAGTYTDTLTFTISLIGDETTASPAGESIPISPDEEDADISLTGDEPAE